MTWPCFTLGSSIAEIEPPGELIAQGPDDPCSDATKHIFAIEEGRIILIEWRNLLHCVIYQTPLDDDIARESRMTYLFDHYAENKQWTEFLDNEFGKSYRRSDEQRYALWSYCMDYQTFGTMAYLDHEVEMRHRAWHSKHGGPSNP